MDKLTDRLNTTFAIVSCLSTNTVSRVGWYVDSGISQNMIANRSTFFRLKKEGIDLQVKLGDDGKYPFDLIGFYLILHGIHISFGTP